MKVLVTGAAGFAGRWLVQSLAERGHVPVATDVQVPPALPGATSLHALNILDSSAVATLIRDTRPDACIHMAAIAFVPDGQQNPAPMLDVNIHGTLNVLESLRAHAPEARFLFISTAQVYGDTPGRVTEDAPPKPISFYAISKAGAELVVQGFVRNYGIPALIARPTNHTGPGQGHQYAVPAFARQVHRATLHSGRCVVRVGNLDSERAFMDVRDVSTAYIALIETGQTGQIYNIGGDDPTPMRTVLDTLCRIADVRVETETDPNLWRPADRAPALDCRKILAHTDWRPTYSLEQTLADVLRDVQDSKRGPAG